MAERKYEYKYEKDAEKDKNKVIDYGIKYVRWIAKEKKKDIFVCKRLKKYIINIINNNVGRHYLVRKMLEH